MLIMSEWKNANRPISLTLKSFCDKKGVNSTNITCNSYLNNIDVSGLNIVKLSNFFLTSGHALSYTVTSGATTIAQKSVFGNSNNTQTSTIIHQYDISKYSNININMVVADASNVMAGEGSLSVILS